VSALCAFAVLQDLDFLDCHESAADHPVEHGEEGVDLVLGIDDLDNDRQIL